MVNCQLIVNYIRGKILITIYFRSVKPHLKGQRISTQSRANQCVGLVQESAASRRSGADGSQGDEKHGGLDPVTNRHFNQYITQVIYYI